MSHDNWMIYGAYGYSGALVVEEAVRRGHRPLLAGRDEGKVAALGERFGLPWVAFGLGDMGALSREVARVELVFHAAGPFVHTSERMRVACLLGGTHYVDITGEIPVLLQTLAHDEDARRRGVVLMSGAGFDVIPTDCLANYVAQQVEEPTTLEVAIAGGEKLSAGTTKTMLEQFAQGGMVRREGQLRAHSFGTGARTVSFSHGERVVIPIPWGDLATAYQSTGIPNITTYLAFPLSTIRLIRLMAPLGRHVVALTPMRRLLQKLVEHTIKGPDAQRRQIARAYLWAKVSNQHGQSAQAWLETIEVYRFTALAAVRCVEKLLSSPLKGALTPAQALGTDFVLEIEGTRREG